VTTTGQNREFDIVVFGATGFTGGMTAEYLARHAPPDLKLAIAGRNLQKLEAIKARLVALDERHAALGTIEAAIDDPESLARMAARTRVLLTTVGPFIDYGEPTVRACIAARTDYVDSTGEPEFVRILLERYSDQAAQAGVRLVPSCGFDAIPADLGAFFTVNQLPQGEPIRLNGYLTIRATFSGGTERSTIKSLARPLREADGARPATPGRRLRVLPARIQRHPQLGGWSGPMPTIDASVVLRSATALERYGPDFSYAHHSIHASFIALIAALWVFGLLMFLGRFARVRELLLNMVKKSGEGPSKEQMNKQWFKLCFVGESAGKTVTTQIAGGDPGYRETSKMLAESALCLARDRERLPDRAGVLTPAVAMGNVLLERLDRAGLKFERL